jgi:hypothetical protein
MGGQRTLFMEMQQGLPEGEPRGFRHREQVIREAEEVALAAGLEKLALKPFEFDGHFGNRRVVNFGLKYDFGRRSVEKAEQMTVSIVPARESDGTRTNRNLESSLACRS